MKITAWRLLLRTQSKATEQIEGDLKRAGMPPLAWYDVLFALDEAPGKKLRMLQLAENMLLSRSNITRLADRLEAKGLIVREPDPADRRGSFARLTRKGAAMRKHVWPVYHRGIEAYFASRITESDAKKLTEMLSRILRGMDGEGGRGNGVDS